MMILSQQKPFRKMLISLLILLTLSTSLHFSTSQAKRPINDESQIVKDAVERYFVSRYEKRLGNPNNEIIQFLPTQRETTTNEWFQIELKRQEIEKFILDTFDVQYLDYNLFLDIKNVVINENTASVEVIEGHDVHFSSSPDVTSELRNLHHQITLIKEGGTWKIMKDTYEDEWTEILDNMTLDEIKTVILENKMSAAIDSTIIASTENTNLLATTYYYNGIAAANYAKQWAKARNSLYYDYGNNDCTNFVSQAIYEGTNGTMSIPNPDYYNTAWYYINNPPRIGSKPWINVGALYTFITTNTGKGPYGYNSGAYLCNLGLGDPISMKSGSTWRHTVIVTSIIGSCHDPAKILISAHSDNYLNRPLIYYSVFSWYALTIQGYRK